MIGLLLFYCIRQEGIKKHSKINVFVNWQRVHSLYEDFKISRCIELQIHNQLSLWCYFKKWHRPPKNLHITVHREAKEKKLSVRSQRKQAAKKLLVFWCFFPFCMSNLPFLNTTRIYWKGSFMHKSRIYIRTMASSAVFFFF